MNGISNAACSALVITTPNAAPTHFDFYNGDYVRDCLSASGDVGFEVQLGDRLLTGNVEFAAEGTPTKGTGHLTMTNDWGYSLTGAVTCFNRIDAKTAVFSGTITDATKYAIPGYFIAKVVDNGSAGDKIVVFVNEHGNADCSDPSDGSDGSDILADVTSGNLVVH